MFRYLLVSVLLFCAYTLKAQTFPSELWHDGKVVLAEGDTLKGSLKYNLQNDIVQLKQGNRAEAFTARKLLFFEIFDQTVANYRQFYVLPYNNAVNYKVPIIFEVLFEGKLTLLTREEITTQTANYGTGYYPSRTYSRQVLVYNFFLLDSKGNITPYFGKKKDLLQVMGRRAADVKEYARKYNLNFDRREDLTRIIAYYNSLDA